ncbi:AAA family ATPase [Photorhabdus luminescens]|uniref:AAA family ATPase n=1 Tax=Photorhabdus akhurstii TaxID=171438 RepID=A0ABX8LMN7_9GAMM|nr:RNA-binding domain-containing protein [Photorhabdus akhurstii]QXF31872.1 AAA family ATPase [Photorhabdus akhurstii]UJD73666.1 AAA family ATPase [Photorhabdus luminescens]
MSVMLQKLLDLQTLVETSEVEFKLANGRDGKGELPRDFWPSYSAMANSGGGWVILGVKEKKGKFTPVGIENIEKIKSDLFNTVNNPSMVSINLLTDSSVQSIKLQGKDVVAVRIPAALRKQKPVFIKGDPLKGTYQRRNESDQLCDAETVKRWLAEQVEDERDARILTGFDITDLNMDSLKTFRQLLASAKPNHPYLEHELSEFLRLIRAWRKDRVTGQEGLTLAGILMFGNWDAIMEAAPHYFVDYQERPEAKTELRWIDRIYPDGTWSGNLFDFYRKVYRKLITDLKIPFGVKHGQRQDDTLVHIALREALVNTLVHADFTGRVSILVVKRPDMFGFRNPGLMRVPVESAIKGGDSDCRNRIMHQMFLLIGLGERAGSGLPKIYSGWSSADWRRPNLHERQIPEQTLLELPTVSLIPENILMQLKLKFGAKFEQLENLDRMILATVAVEGWINHQRACELTTLHSREVTLAFPRLEHKGFLVSSGEKRNKSYTLPGMSLPDPEELFSTGAVNNINNMDLPHKEPSLPHMESSLPHKEPSLPHMESSLPHKEPSLPHIVSGTQTHRDTLGRLTPLSFSLPFIDSLEYISLDLRKKLEEIAKPAYENRRLEPEEMQLIIMKLCQSHYIRIDVLSILLNRSAKNLRQRHIKPLLDKQCLMMAFPQTPSHPNQGYTVRTLSQD